MTFLTILFLTFVSCSKDDASSGGEITGTLQGTWILENFEYEGFSESTIDGMMMKTTYVGIAENMSVTTTFHENGIFESQGIYDVILTGEGMTIPYRNLTFSSKGNYKISGNTIEITNFDGQSTPGSVVAATEKEMTILELTERKLVLDFSEEIWITEGEDQAYIFNSGQYIYSR